MSLSMAIQRELDEGYIVELFKKSCVYDEYTIAMASGYKYCILVRIYVPVHAIALQNVQFSPKISGLLKDQSSFFPTLSPFQRVFRQ